MVAQLGASVIKGIQGVTVLEDSHIKASQTDGGWSFTFNSTTAYVPTGAAACAKHFIGYSAPRSGHDRTPVYLPMRELQQYYLPPWKAAMEAGNLCYLCPLLLTRPILRWLMATCLYGQCGAWALHRRAAASSARRAFPPDS